MEETGFNPPSPLVQSKRFVLIHLLWNSTRGFILKIENFLIVKKYSSGQSTTQSYDGKFMKII